MTELLEQAIARARALPESDQDALASALLSTLDPGDIPPLDDETRRAISEGVEQARRGEFATDEEMEAVWKRFEV